MKYERGHKSRPVRPNASTALQRFLVVRTDRLGDVTLTLPMAGAIKRAFHRAHVSFLVRSYTQPIIERSPDVDEIFIAEDGISFRELIRKFRSSKSEVVFFPSPRFRLALAAFFARVPRRIGTGYRWYSFLFTDRIFEHRHTAEHHEAEYNLRMLSQVGIAANENEDSLIVLRDAERFAVDQWLASNLSDPRAKFAVFHITNGGSTQPWPLQNFVELGRKFVEERGMTIILTGLRQDIIELEDASARIGKQNTVVFIDHLLLELGALFERAAFVISTGTGPGHLAAALGAPTIGLFPLPTTISKERWGFRGPQVSNLSPQAVAGCPTCERCTCMERLDVSSVLEAIDHLQQS